MKINVTFGPGSTLRLKAKTYTYNSQMFAKAGWLAIVPASSYHPNDLGVAYIFEVEGDPDFDGSYEGELTEVLAVAPIPDIDYPRLGPGDPLYTLGNHFGLNALEE